MLKHGLSEPYDQVELFAAVVDLMLGPEETNLWNGQENGRYKSNDGGGRLGFDSVIMTI